MGLKQGLHLRQSQSLVMTPQLQQAIKLLQLNRTELVELINQELAENPMLEESVDDQEGGMTQPEMSMEEGSPESGESPTQDPEAEQRRDEEAFQQPQDQAEQALQTKQQESEINWENYMEDLENNMYSSAPSMREVNEDLPSFENALTKTTTLEDHLNWQLSMSTVTDEERKLGNLIIGNINDEGYLAADFAELCKGIELDPEDAEEVLKLIQGFDPVGIGSRDLRECLLTQAKLLRPRQPLVEKLVGEHLTDIEKKNFNNISKTLNVTLDQIREAMKVILEFDPKPGRNFASADTQYITPDIYVYKVGQEFVISLNDDGMPRLRISPYYRDIMARNKGEKNQAKEYVQDKLKSATWLIRSIHNRQKTIYKVTEAIVNRQRDFFDKGVQFLKPMILKDIANDIGMHESTISRVTTNKYVHTPVGIFELKWFFNASIAAGTGSDDALASEAVKEKIRQIVAKEDPRNPVSDQKIVELLASEKIDIARRTVAKYREMLGILSSAKRKQVL